MKSGSVGGGIVVVTEACVGRLVVFVGGLVVATEARVGGLVTFVGATDGLRVGALLTGAAVTGAAVTGAAVTGDGVIGAGVIGAGVATPLPVVGVKVFHCQLDDGVGHAELTLVVHSQVGILDDSCS